MSLFPTFVWELCWGIECSGLTFPLIRLSFILVTAWTPASTRSPGKSLFLDFIASIAL